MKISFENLEKKILFFCRFCVGDKFYLCENKILCEYDYEERLVFASMACSPSSLAHLKRQIGGLEVRTYTKFFEIYILHKT